MVSVKSTEPSTGGNDAGGSAAASTLTAPADCARRGRAEDAALGAESLVALMRSMDAGVVSSLVRARELAAGVTKSFPGGDERFAALDSDSDEEDGQEDADDEPAEPCQGLFDKTMDAGPEKCLRRAVAEHAFDMRAEMNAAKVPFLVRVRIANYIRTLVRDGHTAEDVMKQAREAIADPAAPVCTDEKWLTPVLPGDLLLTVLEGDGGSEAEESDKEEEAEAAAVAETVRQILG